MAKISGEILPRYSVLYKNKWITIRSLHDGPVGVVCRLTGEKFSSIQILGYCPHGVPRKWLVNNYLVYNV